MESASQSARNILTGLHDIMAAKSNAQAKLNQVVNIIGEALFKPRFARYICSAMAGWSCLRLWA